MPIDWINVLSTITWGNFSNFLVNIGITGALVWVAVQFVAKKTIDYNVNRKMQEHKGKLDKELEQYETELLIDIKNREHNLQVLTEEVKLDNIRRAQDFSLYTNKRHESYTKLNELLIGSYSAGFRIIMNFGPDFKEMTNEEIKLWLEKRSFGQKDNDKVLTLLEKSRSQAESELTVLWHQHIIYEARREFAELKNYYLVSKLYLSQAITNDINDYISKTSLMLSYHDLGKELNVKGKDITTLDKELSELIDKMTSVMKSELKRGYYSDDD